MIVHVVVVGVRDCDDATAGTPFLCGRQHARVRLEVATPDRENIDRVVSRKRIPAIVQRD